MNGNNAFGKYDEYLEKLLKYQYKASDILTHDLTKGESREDFLIDILKERYSNLNFYKGQLIDNYGSIINKQQDIMISDNCACVRKLGNQNLVELEDILYLIEVKTSAVKNDFDELEKNAKNINLLKANKKCICGLFTYRLANKKKSSRLKDFGITYDPDIMSYEFEKENAKYNNIDFVFCLLANEEDDDGNTEEESQYNSFLIMKDEKNEYLLYTVDVITKFLNIFRIHR